MEDMTLEEMRERTEELEEVALEYELLCELLYLVDEGFIEMEDGKFYEKGSAEYLC